MKGLWILPTIVIILAIIPSIQSTMTMNKHGDLIFHSLLNGNVVFNTGTGDIVVERNGRSINLLSSLAVLDVVAGQLCFTTPQDIRPPWVNVTTMLFPAADIAAVSIGSEIYIIGGTDVNNTVLSYIQVYNVMTESWTYYTMATGRTQPFAALDPSFENIYIFGGMGPSGSIANNYEIFNIGTKNSTLFTGTSESRFTEHLGGSSAVVENMVYFFGGATGNTIHGTIDIFDMSENKFVNLSNPLPALDPPRKGMAVTSVGDIVYLIGGRTPVGKTNMVQTFDTTKKLFLTRSPFGLERENMAAVSYQSLIFLAGGLSNITNPIHYDCDVINSRTLKYSNAILNGMNSPREGFALVMVDADLYAIGGRSVPTSPSNVIERTTPCFK